MRSSQHEVCIRVWTHVLLLTLGVCGVASCGDARTELITAPVAEAKPPSSSNATESSVDDSSVARQSAGDAGVYSLTPCETTADCTDEDLRLCHPTEFRCVECVTDGHCSEIGEACSSVLGECAVPCENDDDCMDDDSLCDRVIGYCVECLVNDDCLPGWLCRRSDCVRP